MNKLIDDVNRKHTYLISLFAYRMSLQQVWTQVPDGSCGTVSVTL